MEINGHKIESCAKLRGANLHDADLRCADLTGADLQYADLRGADLLDTDLRDVNLCDTDMHRANLHAAKLAGADLREARGVRYAYISWSEHGECGRRLLAVVIDGVTMFFCGCFHGEEADLRKYINEGDPKLAASRTRAMDVLVDILRDFE